MDMEQATWKSGSADALLAEFFAHDDLKALAADAGALLECPLLVLDDTFHVTAHHRPLGFTDPFFQDAVRQGEITYEAGAIISQSEALSAGRADYVKLDGVFTDVVFMARITAAVSHRLSAPACGWDILFVWILTDTCKIFRRKPGIW